MIEKSNTNKYFIPFTNRNNSLIVPIFMPFWACPQICVFCNQALQTGQGEKHNTIANNVSSLANTKTLLDKVRSEIMSIQEESSREIELAFYGGTFSALPDPEFNYALDFLSKLKQDGHIQSARCSTRPDACPDNRLTAMKKAGIDTIELGIQSFANTALACSNRGYDEITALSCCKKIQDFGFNLGIQLMPNLPAQTREDFLQDIEKVLEIKPDCIRLYPCLVVEGTPLASMWQRGEHKVWDFHETKDLLAHALYSMWRANIPVIRIGVASEPEFYKKVLAGVQHEALGQLTQAAAFKLLIKAIIEENALSHKKILWHFPLQAKGYTQLQKDIFWQERAISAQSIVWHEHENIYFEVLS